MLPIRTNYILAIIGIAAIIGAGVLFFINRHKKASPIVTPPEPVVLFEHKTIGASVEGRNIEAYLYGNGATRLLFVGGVHGGYEWNSVVLAYQLIDYLKENPEIVPENVTVAIIPSLNPDGVYRVVGKNGRFSISDIPTKKLPLGTGRFNAHAIDLNRNFACNWQPKSMWQGKVVNAGSKAFSEPEAATLRDFVLEYKPKSVIFWHSKANTIYASECNAGILPETVTLMNIYAKASGYNAVKSFDGYKISGDSEGWLASINIPAITVELKTHETVEWNQNFAGIKAILKHYRSNPVSN